MESGHIKSFLDGGSFVPYFNGDRILLARSQGKAWHWHKVYSSPTSRGFVKNKSCQTNLIFLRVSERGEAGDVIHLDCSKAFDTVSYGVPTSKVGEYGRGEML